MTEQSLIRRTFRYLGGPVHSLASRSPGHSRNKTQSYPNVHIKIFDWPGEYLTTIKLARLQNGLHIFILSNIFCGLVIYVHVAY